MAQERNAPILKRRYPSAFPHGWGRQGGVIRMNNYVRYIRDCEK
jgi:hypothetical protein